MMEPIRAPFPYFGGKAKAKGGGYQGADDRERIWTSPACIGGTEAAQTDLFGGAT